MGTGDTKSGGNSYVAVHAGDGSSEATAAAAATAGPPGPWRLPRRRRQRPEDCRGGLSDSASCDIISTPVSTALTVAASLGNRTDRLLMFAMRNGTIPVGCTTASAAAPTSPRTGLDSASTNTVSPGAKPRTGTQPT